MAMTDHFQDSPKCQGKLHKLADYDDPAVRRKIKDHESKFTQDDYRRWEGR
jgi:hypothetical protein